MKKIFKTVILVILLSLLFNAADVRASEVTEMVRTTIDKALKILNDPSLKGTDKEFEKREKLRAAIKERIDFGEMSQRSLARHWGKRTEAEKKEFVAIFSSLLENSYMDRIEENSDAEVRYDNEKKADGKVEVSTSVVTRKGLVVPIKYRLMNKGGDWVIYDIVIEGVSLVSNYRTQFDKIIRSSSYEELVTDLRKKADARDSTRRE